MHGETKEKGRFMTKELIEVAKDEEQLELSDALRPPMVVNKNCTM